MVVADLSPAELRQRAWEAAASVADPEIPVLTIDDLGVLREVELVGDRVDVAITPTYSGCPAMNMIALEIELALERAGFREARVRTVLSPAWTTDWMSEVDAASCATTALPRRSHQAAGARCSASPRWHARNAAPSTPSNSRSSARPPARRCGVANRAASRLIISNVTDATSVIASAATRSRAARAALHWSVALLLAMTRG